MTRRELLQTASLAVVANRPAEADEPLTWQGDIADKLMDGAHAFIDRKIGESIAQRERFWHRDLSSREAYEKSVAPNRARLQTIIGAIDQREPVAMERFSAEDDSSLVAQTESYRAHQVRWPVLSGVHGEGLLIEPTTPPRAYVVALPDADQTPELIASEYACRLAASGITVLIPTLVNRDTNYSGHPDIKRTDQPHREWIYRQAFHMGRHIIGYEVQKVQAAVDWFQRRRTAGGKIGVIGYAEGGLIAFYAAAVDTRIDVALISGYFDNRQHIASEPIYRNVWSLLNEFGDAEIATLIAPRSLIVEHRQAPEINSPRGDLRSPQLNDVKVEFDRIERLTKPNFQPLKLVTAPDEALASFAKQLGVDTVQPSPSFHDQRKFFDPEQRQKRQVQELERHVQSLIRSSDKTRQDFFLFKIMPELADETWSTKLRHDTFPPQKFIEAAKPYRRYFHEEVLGKFDEPFRAPNPRTRQILDQPKWTAHEVVLDVFPELIAWGILVVPKNIKSGERRPVVVCQHGRNGVPIQTIQGDVPFYHNFAARLAEEGFITFSPHNLYRGEDRYRWLCRKANGVKATLFSFILAQHEQILRWLASLSYVDPKRIGFYGLSYGGETAVRVPPILENYALSICSGDFNTWNEKVAATDERFSFMYSIEWEMPYWNMGAAFDYAEMAYLMIPRPFMVERGHNDQVGRDQWVAYQYAKVRWLYAQLGMEDRTEMEYFNGGHTINGEGTFRFLRKHLRDA